MKRPALLGLQVVLLLMSSHTASERGAAASRRDEGKKKLLEKYQGDPVLRQKAEELTKLGGTPGEAVLPSPLGAMPVRSKAPATSRGARGGWRASFRDEVAGETRPPYELRKVKALPARRRHENGVTSPVETLRLDRRVQPAMRSVPLGPPAGAPRSTAAFPAGTLGSLSSNLAAKMTHVLEPARPGLPRTTQIELAATVALRDLGIDLTPAQVRGAASGASASAWKLRSCREYAVRRRFDRLWFTQTAKYLGADYRGAFALFVHDQRPGIALPGGFLRTLRSLGPNTTAEFQEQVKLPNPRWNPFFETYEVLALSGGPKRSGKPGGSGSSWQRHRRLEEARRSTSDAVQRDIDLRIAKHVERVTAWKLAVVAIGQAMSDLGRAHCWVRFRPELGVWDPGGTPDCKRAVNPGSKPPAKDLATPEVNAWARRDWGMNPAERENRTKALDALVERYGLGGKALRSGKRSSPGSAPAPVAGAPFARPGMKEALGRVVVELQGYPKVQDLATALARLVEQKCSAVLPNTFQKDLCPEADKLAASALQQLLDAVLAKETAEREIAADLSYEAGLGAKGCLHPKADENLCNWTYGQFRDVVFAALGTSEAGQVLAPSEADLQACRTLFPEEDFEPKDVRALLRKLVAEHRLFPGDLPAGWCDFRFSQTVELTFRFLRLLAGAPESYRRYEEDYREHWKKDQERYLGCTRAQAKPASRLPRRSTGALGQDQSEGFNEGGELFGASTTFKAGWTLTAAEVNADLNAKDVNPECSKGKCNEVNCGFESHICRLGAELHATASADVRVLTDVGLLEGQFNASSKGENTHADMTFVVLGHQLAPSWGPLGRDAPAAAFDLSFPAKSEPLAKAAGEMTFMAGPIPILVRAGTNVSAGVDFQVAGGSGNSCASKSANGPPFGFNARLTPFVRADAYAQGGVGLDLGIAEVSAGVRVDLNLLSLSFPMTLSFGSGSEKFQAGVSGEATVGALSGGLSLYAEVEFLFWEDRWEIPLYSWTGLSEALPLFSIGPPEMPLRALSRHLYDAKAAGFDMSQLPYPKLTCSP
jgi:hypothetical protein